MKSNFLRNALAAMLCTINTLSAARGITNIIYALNTRGEMYANVNGTWSKGPALPKQGLNVRPISTIAAGPSVERPDGTMQGQLYALDAFYALWSMPEVSVTQPFGNGLWESTNNPALLGIAVGKDQLIGFMYEKQKLLFRSIWDKQNLATKGVFDKDWTVDTNADANFVALSPDLPATAFHVGYHSEFNKSKCGYKKPFYAQLGKTGWLDVGPQFRKIYAGVEGSCVGIYESGQMFANQQIFNPQSSWVELVPPQLSNITTIENPNDADQWTLSSSQVNLAFGFTTNNAGQVINEIMMSMQLTCQNKQQTTKRPIKNVLWRRSDITTQNRFGLGWELVSLNSETDAPGLITALSIGSFDQTKEVEKAQRAASAAQAATEAQTRATQKAADTAAAKIAKEEKAKKQAAQKAADKKDAQQRAKEFNRFKSEPKSQQ
jgi:hypothetical protein